LNLSDLEVLLRAAELGSVRAAALELGLSRASARRALDRLERDVDAQLLHRNSTGVDLTEAGRMVVERGRQLAHDGASLRQAAQRATAETLGTFRLVVPVGMERNGRLLGMQALRALHPDLHIHVREAEDPLTLLRTPFDLMLFFGKPPETGDWYSRRIITMTSGLFASERYLARHGEPESLEELALRPVLQWTVAAPEPGHIPGPGGVPAPISPALTSANMDLIVDAALSNLGIGFGVVDPPVRFGEGLRRVLPEVQVTMGLWMLSARPGRLDPRVAGLQRNLEALLDQVLTR